MTEAQETRLEQIRAALRKEQETTRDCFTPATHDLLAMVDQLCEEADCQRGPRWTCASCGSGFGFNTIKYDTPGEPVEYDMECEACGGLDIAESPGEAADALGGRLESALAERDSLRAQLAEAVDGECARAEERNEAQRLQAKYCFEAEALRARVADLEGALWMFDRHEKRLADTKFCAGCDLDGDGEGAVPEGWHDVDCRSARAALHKGGGKP